MDAAGQVWDASDHGLKKWRRCEDIYSAIRGATEHPEVDLALRMITSKDIIADPSAVSTKIEKLKSAIELPLVEGKEALHLIIPGTTSYLDMKKLPEEVEKISRKGKTAVMVLNPAFVIGIIVDSTHKLVEDIRFGVDHKLPLRVGAAKAVIVHLAAWERNALLARLGI